MALWIGCTLLALWLVVSIIHTLVVFGAAFAITLALAPLVTRATHWTLPGVHRRLSWRAAVIVVYLMVTCLFVVCVTAAVPVVVEQARSIAAEIPEEMPRLQGVLDDWQHRFDRWKLPPRMKQTIEGYVRAGVENLGNSLARGFDLAASGIMNAFSLLLIVFAAYIIAVFLLLNYPEMSAGFYAAIPEPYRTDVRGLVGEMNRIFGGFVRGTGNLAVLIGMVNYLSLTMLGLVNGFPLFQYTLLVSVLSAVGYLIPVLGIAVTSLIGGLLAWFQFPSLVYVVTVALILLVGGNAVDRLVGPKIMSNAMGVSPIFVVFAAFAGAELCGFWGIVLGVPAAAMLKCVSAYLYRRFLTADQLPVLGVGSAPLIRIETLSGDPLVLGETPTVRLEQKPSPDAPPGLSEAPTVKLDLRPPEAAPADLAQPEVA